MPVPEGAQLSEDGNYWWDGSDWQLVEQKGAGGTEVGTRSEDGNYWWDGSDWQPVDTSEGGAGTCVIGFVDVTMDGQSLGMGPRVIIDVNDNPDGHHVLHEGAGCIAAWGEGNAGTGDGPYSDTWQLDGGAVESVDNLTLPRGTTTTRSVSLGRLSKGKHKFEVTLNGVAYGSHNDFEVEG